MLTKVMSRSTLTTSVLCKMKLCTKEESKVLEKALGLPVLWTSSDLLTFLDDSDSSA